MVTGRGPPARRRGQREGRQRAGLRHRAPRGTQGCARSQAPRAPQRFWGRRGAPIPPASSLLLQLFSSRPVPGGSLQLWGGDEDGPWLRSTSRGPFSSQQHRPRPCCGDWEGGSLRVLEAKTAPQALPRAAEHPPLRPQPGAGRGHVPAPVAVGVRGGGAQRRVAGCPMQKKKTKTTKTNPKWHAEKQTKKENKRKPEAANGLTCANYVRARWGAGEGRAGGKLRSVQRERGRKQKEAA